MIAKLRDRFHMWLYRYMGNHVLNQRLTEHILLTERRFKELTDLAADVRVYGPSKVIITSAVGGGIVKIIEAHFDGLRDVQDFARYCEQRLGVHRGVMDVPRSDPNMRY